jgi:hypothetical protein
VDRQRSFGRALVVSIVRNATEGSLDITLRDSGDCVRRIHACRRRKDSAVENKEIGIILNLAIRIGNTVVCGGSHGTPAEVVHGG